MMGTSRDHKHHTHHHASSSKHSSRRTHSSDKHHHHHKKHHHKKKKSHHKKHKTFELTLDDKILQSALDCLEANALDAIKEGSKFTQDTIDSLVTTSLSKAAATKREEDETNDSDSDSSQFSAEIETETVAVIEETSDHKAQIKDFESLRSGEGDRSSKYGLKDVDEIKDVKSEISAAVKDQKSGISDDRTINEEKVKLNSPQGSDIALKTLRETSSNISEDANKTQKLSVGENNGEKNSKDISLKSGETSKFTIGESKEDIETVVLKSAALKSRRTQKSAVGEANEEEIGGFKDITSGSRGTQKSVVEGDTEIIIVGSKDTTLKSGKTAKTAVGAANGDTEIVCLENTALKSRETKESALREAKGSQSGGQVSKSVALESHEPSVAKNLELLGTNAPEREKKSSRQNSKEPTKSENSESGDTQSGTKSSTLLQHSDSNTDDSSHSDDERNGLSLANKLQARNKKIQINIRVGNEKEKDKTRQSFTDSTSHQPMTGKSKITYTNLKPNGGTREEPSKLEGETKMKDGVGHSTNAKEKRRVMSKLRPRSRSVSRERSLRKKKRYSQSRSRSHSSSRHRSHSRSRHRSHSRSRYERRSCSRGSRSRSQDTRRFRRNRSRSPYSRSKRQRKTRRNRSRSRKRSRSTHHSVSKSRSHSRSHSCSRSPPHSKTKDEVVKSISTIAKGFSEIMDTKSKQKTLSTLTDFCKDLQKKQMLEDELGPEAVSETTAEQVTLEYRAPFSINPGPVYQPGLIFHGNAWKTANQIAAESNTIVELRPLTDQFPVSSGLQHKTSVSEEGANDVPMFSHKVVDISNVAISRLLTTERLKQNPTDFEALSILADLEKQTKVWAESKLTPGQFTGEQKLSGLTKEDHKAGIQAWARKNMFQGLAPVMSGFGMRMMRKMGWEMGQALGKQGIGHLEPIAMDVKVDRCGLTTSMDKMAPVPVVMTAPMLKAADVKSAHLVKGKHPVSALQEICSKKRWDNPVYTLIDHGGPAHNKTFSYEVTIPIGTFRAANASKNKKQAKMEAATAALQGLGLVERQ